MWLMVIILSPHCNIPPNMWVSESLKWNEFHAMRLLGWNGMWNMAANNNIHKSIFSAFLERNVSPYLNTIVTTFRRHTVQWRFIGANVLKKIFRSNKLDIIFSSWTKVNFRLQTSRPGTWPGWVDVHTPINEFRSTAFAPEAGAKRRGPRVDEWKRGAQHAMPAATIPFPALFNDVAAPSCYHHPSIGPSTMWRIIQVIGVSDNFMANHSAAKIATKQPIFLFLIVAVCLCASSSAQVLHNLVASSGVSRSVLTVWYFCAIPSFSSISLCLSHF